MSEFKNKLLKLGLEEAQLASVEDIIKDAVKSQQANYEKEKLDLKLKMSEMEANHKKAIKRENIKAALKDGDEKPFDLDIVMSLLNDDNIEIDSTGKLTGLDSQIQSIKQTKAFLFESSKKEQTGATEGQEMAKDQTDKFKIVGQTPPQDSNQRNGGSKENGVSFGEMMSGLKLQSLGLKQEGA